MRGAWVEIVDEACLSDEEESLPVRGAWVEIKYILESYYDIEMSLPVRGAWVEIFFISSVMRMPFVAPRAGSVG